MSADTSSSPQIDVWDRTKRLSFFLDITVISGIILSLSIFGVSIGVLMHFREAPFVLQQDYGYLKYDPTVLFKLKTSHFEAFIQKVMGGLMHFSADGYDKAYLAPFVHEKVLYNLTKRGQEKAGTARKYNTVQVWNFKEMRRYFDRRYSGVYVLSVRGEYVIYKDNDQEKTIRTEMERGNMFHRLYIAKGAQTFENPWGLVLMNVVKEKSEAAFLKVWKAAETPSDNDPLFNWSLDWRPPKRVQRDLIEEDE